MQTATIFMWQLYICDERMDKQTSSLFISVVLVSYDDDAYILRFNFFCLRLSY